MGKSKDLATGAAYQDQTESDARYANVTGDTFTGLVNITNTYSSDTTEQLRVSDNTGSKLDFFGHANGTKSIQAYADDGSTFYNLNLQPLGGGVTMPNQPCFLARGNTGGWVSVGSGSETDVIFGNAVFDIGSNFNTTNGRFTAPVAGKYLFHFHCYMRLSSYDDDTNYATTRLRKNGSVYENFHNILGYQNNGDSDQHGLLIAIIDLSANDYVTAALKANSGSADFYQPNCNFTGYLIG